MTDAQLTTLSTIAWVIATTALLILLANWSAGGSWGISGAIARGLSGWAGRDGVGGRAAASATELRPIEAPHLERLWASEPGATESGATVLGSASSAQPFGGAEPGAELEDLGARRLP